MGLLSGPRLTERISERASDLPSGMADAIERDRYGGAAPAVPVGYRGSVAIPAVWSAVRLRANLIASFPVDVYRRGADGVAQAVTSPSVLETPASGQDISQWMHASQISLDLRGNSYGIILARDPRTLLPSQIELQHPDDVTLRRRGDGSHYWRIAGKDFELGEVWHETSNDMPGSRLGESPIRACARSLGIQLAAEQFGSDFFRDGAHPTALLTSADELVGDQAKVAKRRFLDVIGRKREPLVLGGNWQYKALSVAPNESQFLELLKFGVEQVARMFDMPAEMIGGSSSGSSVTYANVAEKGRDFLAYRLGTAVGRRQRMLTRLTPRGQYVKLNVSALLATDLITQYKAFELGLKNGFLGLDEVRALMDRPPMTDEQTALLKALGLLGKPSTPTVAAPAAADSTTGA